VQSGYGYSGHPSVSDAGVMTSFTHDTAPTQYAEAGGTLFAYRRFGSPGRPPPVFFQHFMGTMGTTSRSTRVAHVLTGPSGRRDSR
jgi:hypothetical protein